MKKGAIDDAAVTIDYILCVFTKLYYRYYKNKDLYKYFIKAKTVHKVHTIIFAKIKVGLFSFQR